jgi:hypothetical protein
MIKIRHILRIKILNITTIHGIHYRYIFKKSNSIFFIIYTKLIFYKFAENKKFYDLI